jgi:replicative DNA helicase
MGIKIDATEEEPFVDFGKMTDKFLDYANNFEQNIIKTGIKELDDNVMYSTSTLNGLLGNPGAGKTSLAMEFLRNSSINGVTSVFFSMDMGLPVVYAKLIQKAAGVNFKQALDMVKYNPKKTMELIEQIKEEYKNVGFNFKSGLSVKDMESFIKYHEDQTGKKVRLVVADYLECISSKFSDPGASCGLIANELKDLANDQELCVQLLLQTQKHSTPDISDPLLSLKNVKGNSLIEQACTTITTLWREGYNPDFVNDDKYISFAVVKNRFGSLWRGDCAWAGKTGSIRSMTEEEWGEFAAFKERKRLSKIQKEKESNGQWE